MRKRNLLFACFLLLFLTLNISAVWAEQNPQEQLKQHIADLQKNPDDFALREKIIKHVQTMKPAPEISEEARRYFVIAVSLQKKAKDEKGFELAVEEYRQALLIAPWWPEAYYNLGIALESTNKYDDAIKALKLYLTTGPKEGDARETQDRIYAIEAARKLARAEVAEAKKEEEAKPDFSGIWKEHDNPTCWTRKFLISGREITILNLCGERTEVYGTGTVGGRNFEGNSHSGYAIRYKGSLSEDNKTITFSYIRPQWSKWETATWTRVSK